MSAEARTAHIEVVKPVECAINNAVRSFRPGPHFVPKAIADRLVQAGFAVRIKSPGRRSPEPETRQ